MSIKEQVQIVPFQEEDLAECIRIALTVWEGIHAAYTDALGEEIHDFISSDWRERLAENIAEQQRTRRSFVAKYDGKVVGFCACRLEGQLGVVGYNGVDPEFRGNGIASLMYERLFEEMKAMGAIYARVMTGGDPGHAPARKAYEKAGFEKHLDSVTYYKKL